MPFNELKIENNSIIIGVTDLINSFYNAKEFFSNDIDEESKRIISSEDLNSSESHKEFFTKFPIENAIYEMPIKYKVKYKGIFITLSGRIDAFKEEQATVYELKITEKDIDELIYNQTINLFKIQLFIYGYILRRKKYDIKKLKLLIVSKNQKMQKEYEYDFNNEKIYFQLKKIFSFLFDLYQFEKSKKKNQLKEPIFPYPVKKNIQNEIIKNLYNSDKQITFIEAPFASGKTAAILYGLAIKYNFSQIHYFTSRNIQKTQVKTEGDNIGYSSIIRKSFPDTCQYSYSFCKRYNCNLFQYPIEKYSISKKAGCPVIYDRLFYSMFDLIISDYNYFFCKALSKGKDTICVIDEYHSFLTRIANFFSVTIDAKEVQKIKELVMTKYKRLGKSFLSLFEMDEFRFEKDVEIDDNSYYQDIYKNSLNYNVGNSYINDSRSNQKIHIDEIINPMNLNFLEKLFITINQTMKYIKDNSVKDMSDFENEIYPFFNKLKTIAELSQYQMVISYNKNINEKIFTYKSLKFILEKLFYGYKKVIGISATLEPKELLYHVHEKNDFVIYSQNNPKKIRVNIITTIETIYKKREKNSFIIAKSINEILLEENKFNSLINKSILIFFPSYEFIKIVELFLINKIFDKILISKTKNFNGSNLRVYNYDIENIEEFFIKDKIHLLFLPYRSIIQEGANLNFDIAGGICVGIPFRVPDSQYLTQSILIDEYSENSFEILSLFPALNDVLQSSGRIGRKKEENCFIYFIGKEYLNKKIYDSIIDCYSEVQIK